MTSSALMNEAVTKIVELGQPEKKESSNEGNHIRNEIQESDAQKF